MCTLKLIAFCKGRLLHAHCMDTHRLHAHCLDTHRLHAHCLDTHHLHAHCLDTHHLHAHCLDTHHFISNSNDFRVISYSRTKLLLHVTHKKVT